MGTTSFYIGGAIMEVVLKRMGNSTALVMPPPVLRDLRLAVGHHLRLDTTEDGRIVLTPRHKYSLAEMVAQCDLKAPEPADMQLWNAAGPVGQEVW